MNDADFPNGSDPDDDDDAAWQEARRIDKMLNDFERTTKNIQRAIQEQITYLEMRAADDRDLLLEIGRSELISDIRLAADFVIRQAQQRARTG